MSGNKKKKEIIKKSEMLKIQIIRAWIRATGILLFILKTFHVSFERLL